MTAYDPVLVRPSRSGIPLILDVVEGSVTELDNGTRGNISLAIVATEGFQDSQWTFGEATEFTNDVGGLDLVDSLTFESVGEDGGYHGFRVKVEIEDIDSLGAEEGVDYGNVVLAINGEIIDGDSWDLADVGTADIDTQIAVRDGDVVQFAYLHSTTQDVEADVTFEALEAQIIII
jgi:hypothetical protein